jgi:hypothetical protein
MPDARYWRRGETIMHRHVGHGDGRVIGWPHVVVEDGPERTVLYQPEGAPFLIWSLDEQRFEPHLTVRMFALRIIYPHRPYYVSLWFKGDTGMPSWWQPHFGGDYPGRFRGWKVDMCSPHRRTEIGFDTSDDVLDYIVHPDFAWYIKDDDDLTGFTSAGVYTEAEAARIRKACRDVLPLIEARTSPFDAEWISWQPAPGLALGDLPANWHLYPGADMHTTTLHYERGEPGRLYDAYRAASTVPLWSWRSNWHPGATGDEIIAEGNDAGVHGRGERG